MPKPRYLANHDSSCQRYRPNCSTQKKRVCEHKNDDDFLRRWQLQNRRGELASVLSDGCDVKPLDYEAVWLRPTTIKDDNVVIFEAAIKHQNLFCR